MGYYVKMFVGAVLFLAALVAFNYALLNLLETGTCASGNTPYEIAKPCPAGTGSYVGLLIGSIFGGLIGAGIFAFRGDPPGRSRPLNSGNSWGLTAWGLFFGATGIAALIGSFAGDLPPDGKLGGVIVGITFALMGVPVLLFLAWGAVKGIFGRGDERPAMAASGSGAAPTAGGGLLDSMRAATTQTSSGAWRNISAASGGGGGGDAIERIGRLDDLRRSGALTQAEFDKQKAKILAEG